MKNAIAITLIVCGTFLFTIPAIYNGFISQSKTFLLMNHIDAGSPGRGGDYMHVLFCWAHWSAGFTMVLIAVWMAFLNRTR